MTHLLFLLDACSRLVQNEGSTLELWLWEEIICSKCTSKTHLCVFLNLLWCLKAKFLMNPWGIVNNFENWSWHIFFFFKCFCDSFGFETFSVGVQIIFDIFGISNDSVYRIVHSQWDVLSCLIICLCVFGNIFYKILAFQKWEILEVVKILRKIDRLRLM